MIADYLLLPSEIKGPLFQKLLWISMLFLQRFYLDMKEKHRKGRIEAAEVTLKTDQLDSLSKQNKIMGLNESLEPNMFYVNRFSKSDICHRKITLYIVAL